MLLLVAPVRSSIGQKYLMAITGLLLTGFVLAHMTGNLLLYAGPDALNAYAAALKSHPALLWTARLGLLAVFLLHLFLALRLAAQNRKARPVPYQFERTIQASWASRHMLLTGLVLLAFIVYHLAHFTLGVVEGAAGQRRDTPGPGEGRWGALHHSKNFLDLAEIKSQGARHYTPAPSDNLATALAQGEDARHDVYSMVVAGFRNPFITVSYVLAMVFLALHLWHGGSSWFQSLGLNSPRWEWLTGSVGPFLAVAVFVGNCSIPVSVLLGIVP
jgi:succinate dehydrogenase / fumarate reductase cytochrome b subunit